MAAPPVEDLGSYQPRTKAAAFKRERVSYWLGVGAQPTVSVHNLLVAQGIVSGAKHAVKMAKPVAKEAPAAEVATTETAASEPAQPETETPEIETPAAETPAEETPAA